MSRLGLAGLTAAAGLWPRRGRAQEAPTCRIAGVSGGGVVRTDRGDITLALFASRFVDEEGQPAEGKVRWFDPSFEGGLTLESVGLVVYGLLPDDPRSREVQGIVSVNGERDEPFVLRVTDNGGTGDEATLPDRCSLQVGSAIDGGSGDWGYEVGGDLVGGDLILLSPSGA